MSLPDQIQIRWYPIPNRPWVVEDTQGKKIQGFNAVQDAQKWIEKLGYSVNMGAIK